MPTTNLVRIGAVCTVIGALCMFGHDAGLALLGQSDDTYNATVAEQVASAVFLVGKVLSVMGLTGLYLYQAPRAGRLGLIAYLTALAGSTLMVGSDWSGVFLAPILHTAAPELTNDPPTLLMVGFIMNFALETLGWLLFGVASLRAGIYPRTAAGLLVAGTLLPPVGPSWIFVVWYGALVWMGVYALRRPAPAPATPSLLVAKA